MSQQLTTAAVEAAKFYGEIKKQADEQIKKDILCSIGNVENNSVVPLKGVIIQHARLDPETINFSFLVKFKLNGETHEIEEKIQINNSDIPFSYTQQPNLLKVELIKLVRIKVAEKVSKYIVDIVVNSIKIEQ